MAKLKPTAVIKTLKDRMQYLRERDSFSLYLTNKPVFEDAKDLMEIADRIAIANLEIRYKADELAQKNEKEYEKFINDYAKRQIVLLKSVKKDIALDFPPTDNVFANIMQKEEELRLSNSFAYELVSKASYKSPSKLSNVLNKLVMVGNEILKRADVLFEENKPDYRKFLKSYCRMLESLNKQITATNEVATGNHI